MGRRSKADYYQRIGGILFVAAGFMTLAAATALFVGTILLFF